MLATRERPASEGLTLASAYVQWREMYGGLLRPTPAFATYMVGVERQLARYLHVDTFVRLRAAAAARARRTLAEDVPLATAWTALFAGAWAGERSAEEATLLRERILSLRKHLLRRYLNMRVKVVSKKLLNLVAQGQGQAIRNQLKAATQLLKTKSSKKSRATAGVNFSFNAALINGNMEAADLHVYLQQVAKYSPAELLSKLNKEKLTALLDAYGETPPKKATAKQLHALLVTALAAKSGFSKANASLFKGAVGAASPPT